MADEGVRAAVAHWSARMVANGVPLGDVTEVTGGLERWDDWLRAWSDRAQVHERLGDQALAEGRGRSAGEHLVTAAVCHHFGKFLFVSDLGQMRRAHERAVACLARALPLLDPPGERVAIPFEGRTLSGVLRVPACADPPPVVLMLSGLDSAKEEMGAYEQPFLDRGMATLAFDGPGQGEAEYDLPIRSDWEVPVGAVLDWLDGQDRVDHARVALFGVSLGGYYAPRAAAFHPRVRACIAVSGPYDLSAEWDRLPALTRETFRVRSRSGTDEEARTKARALSLAGVAERITCPLLVVSGSEDRLFPVAHAQRLAGEAGGPATLLLVEGGGHVVNNLPYRYRPQAADWAGDMLMPAAR